MKTYFYKNLANSDIQKLIKRPIIDFEKISRTIKPIMDDVRINGDKALIKYAKKFENAKLKNLKVTPEEITRAIKKLNKKTASAFKKAAKNIEKFHKSQISNEKPVETMKGVICFRESRPIEKIGLYIPAKSAPLPSTVLMLGIPAKIAGCKLKVLCAPPAQNGQIAPEILYAANLCDITEIYKTGGAQAIAAMAYGTESIPKVDKIFGPGNQYVTAAKMLVSIDQIQTAIDMPAGPSELLIIADKSANPAFIAADLLSQAEHGSDSQVILICISKKTVNLVKMELIKQLNKLPRKGIAKTALKNGFYLITENLNQAIEFSNLYAPEHLILNLKKPEKFTKKIINAGSVFLGEYSCESAGDYASGTNHSLPTYGYAKTFSGVSIDSFVKKITFQKLNAEGVKNLGQIVEKMAETEQLYAHKNAMTLRIKSL